jgi:GntR family transcriptional regulator, transcriptional repressor for pyruvate dehydrogenase complex
MDGLAIVRGNGSDSAAELVVGFLRGQIESGLLRPGDRLPAERDLARRIGVSRPSVRAGLRTLSAMGVVQTRHGSGTYITNGRPALDNKALGMLAALHGFRPEQVAEARRVLEMGVAALSAERAAPDQVAVMANEVAGMFDAAEQPLEFDRHDLRFHRALAAATGNPVLAALVEMVLGLRARDPERASREVSQHLARASKPAGPALAMVRAR